MVFHNTLTWEAIYTIAIQEQDCVIMVDVLMKNHLNAHHNGQEIKLNIWTVVRLNKAEC